eukprot:scpid92455/ scgid25717/ 
MDFYRACQTEGETFTSFYTILKELNAACNFQSPLEAVCHDCRTTIEACEHCNTRVKQVHSETMRDRILVGIRSDETRHNYTSRESRNHARGSDSNNYVMQRKLQRRRSQVWNKHARSYSSKL